MGFSEIVSCRKLWVLHQQKHCYHTIGILSRFKTEIRKANRKKTAFLEFTTSQVQESEDHSSSNLSASTPSLFRVHEIKWFCVEQVRLLLSSHRSHLNAVKCNLHIYNQVYNTKVECTFKSVCTCQLYSTSVIEINKFPWAPGTTKPKKHWAPYLTRRLFVLSTSLTKSNCQLHGCACKKHRFPVKNPHHESQVCDAFVRSFLILG